MIIHLDTARYIWEVLENHEYSCVFKDYIVFDAGCNIGAFTFWIYPYAQRIHAVDMEQRNIDLLNQTIQDSQLKNITTYTERILDMAHFMSGHGIDLIDILKLDVEGDEIEILQSNFPKERIRTIVGEYHGKPVEKILTDLGYRYREYPHQHFVARS